MCVTAFSACGSKTDERSSYNFDPDKYVTLGEYENLKVNYQIEEVTDETLDESINSELQAAKYRVEVTDRAIENGDIVNMDYTGTIKETGETFSGGTQTGYEYTVGSGTLLDEFDSALLGIRAGETFTIPITFPESSSVEEVAGKEVEYSVTINKIETEEIPEFTDEYVKGLSIDGVENVDQYKKYKLDELTKQAEETTKSNKENAVWSAVIEDAEVIEYPQKELDDAIQSTKTNFEAQLQSYGLTLDDYIQNYFSGDEAQYNSQIEDSAKNDVKEHLVVYSLVKKLGIEASDKDYKDYLNEQFDEYLDYCEQQGQTAQYTTVSTFEEAVTKDNLLYFYYRTEIVEKLCETAEYTETSEIETADTVEDTSTDAEVEDSAVASADEPEVVSVDTETTASPSDSEDTSSDTTTDTTTD